MGLIKTAMVSGVGLYAINKIAKTAETRRDDRYQGPPPRDGQYDDRYYRQYPDDRQYPDGRQVSPSQQQYRPRDGYDGRNRGFQDDQPMYRDERPVYRDDMYGDYDQRRDRSLPPAPARDGNDPYGWSAMPPQYEEKPSRSQRYQQQPVPVRQTGFVEPEEVGQYYQDQSSSRASGSRMPALAEQVMSSLAGGRSGGNGDKSSSGKDLISGLFK